MSSTTIRSARVILVMVRATEPSAPARPTAAVRDSRVNQATRRPESIAACASASTRWVLPVPEGPVTARFSARPILIDTAVEDGLDDRDTDPPPAPTAPYSITPFDQWATGSPQPPAAPDLAPQQLRPGQNLVLPEPALTELTVEFRFTGDDADLTLLLLNAQHRVRADDDFVFYNQTVAAHGAARLLGKTRTTTSTTEQASIRLTAIPHDVHTIAIAVNMDVDEGLTCAALGDAALAITCPTARWQIPTPNDSQIRAMVLVEIYRYAVNGEPAWKLRAIGQGWADGLDGLARAHGVDIA